MKTKQQALWAGQFGDEYHQRNPQADHLDLWSEIIGARMGGIRSVFEPGAGQGDNLVAIREHAEWWSKECRFTGMDINEGAVAAMNERGLVGIHGAFPTDPIDNKYDLVLTRGFLIHLPNDELVKAFDKIYAMSNRYVCFCEYYSPVRRSFSYRGNRNALWVDDFAGQFMHYFPDVKLLKYAFKYHMECGYDLTYFLMEKGNA